MTINLNVREPVYPAADHAACLQRIHEMEAQRYLAGIRAREAEARIAAKTAEVIAEERAKAEARTRWQDERLADFQAGKPTLLTRDQIMGELHRETERLEDCVASLSDAARQAYDPDLHGEFQIWFRGYPVAPTEIWIEASGQPDDDHHIVSMRYIHSCPATMAVEFQSDDWRVWLEEAADEILDRQAKGLF